MAVISTIRIIMLNGFCYAEDPNISLNGELRENGVNEKNVAMEERTTMNQMKRKKLISRMRRKARLKMQPTATDAPRESCLAIKQMIAAI